MDPNDIDPREIDLEEDFEALEQAQVEVNRLRGEFLTAMADLESVTDIVLAEYFRPQQPDQFYELVLRAISFGRKVDILGELVRDAGLEARYGDAVRRVREVTGKRNTLAHERFEFVGRSFAAEDGSFMLSHRARRGRTGTFDMSRLKEWILEAQELWQELAFLHLRLIQH